MKIKSEITETDKDLSEYKILEHNKNGEINIVVVTDFNNSSGMLIYTSDYYNESILLKVDTNWNWLSHSDDWKPFLNNSVTISQD